jgi:hypothetical protein
VENNEILMLANALWGKSFSEQTDCWTGRDAYVHGDEKGHCNPIEYEEDRRSTNYQ